MLGSGTWKITPWQDFEKVGLQELFDIGFDLAALLELQGPSASSVSAEEIQQQQRLLISCSDIDGRLTQWCILHCPNENNRSHLHGEQTAELSQLSLFHRRQRRTFNSLSEAINAVYYWLLRLVLNELIVAALLPAVISDDASGISKERLAQSSLMLALDILATGSYFLEDDKGWFGPQRYVFPLRRAMMHLSNVGSPLQQEGEATLSRLIARFRPR